MRFIVFVLVLLMSSPAAAQVPMTGAGKGAPGGGGGGPFVGIGDLISTSAYWSLRAYSSADRGNRLVNVCNSTGGVDVGCADLSSSASTGSLVSANVSGITCPGPNCTIKIWYDRSGANACGGAACDVSQATVANRATLPASCLGSLPCATFVKASSQSYTNTTGLGATVQPYTMNAVVERTGTTSVAQGILDPEGAELLFGSTANQLAIFAGSGVVGGSAADNAWHSMTGVFNAASSSVNIDGTATGSLNPGSNNTGGGTIWFGSDHFTEPLDGNIAEVFFLNTTLSAPNQTAVCHNQFTYWGTSVSC